MDDAVEALTIVAAAHGASIDDDRLETLAVILHDQGWMRAELITASRVLASSSKVRDQLRYGRTLSPADFQELREGDVRTVRDEDGERQLVTLSGYALRVRRQRLYSYQDMMALWHATGGQAGPWKTTVDFAQPVHVEGEDLPRWRLNG